MRRMIPDKWPQIVWKWMPINKKERGRPMKTWNADVSEVIDSRRLQEDWHKKERWRLGCGFRCCKTTRNIHKYLLI